MTLVEIAQEISAKLRWLEKDNKYNIRKNGVLRLYNPMAYASGRYLFVKYQAWTGGARLTKVEAQVYLDWLKAGGTGRHWEIKDDSGKHSQSS